MQTNLAIDRMALPQVILDYSQEVQAHATGFARCTESMGNGQHRSWYNKKLNYHEFVGENAEAVGSEIAVAQYFGIKNFVPTVNTFKDAADVGRRIEVKHSCYLNGHLIIRANDRPQDVAVLVIGKSPVYSIVGWMPVAWAKRPKYLNPSDGNWWVSQRELLEMETLKRSMYGTTED